MLSLGKLPTQVHYFNTLLHKPISQNFQFSSKPHFSFPPRFNFHAVLGKSQNGLFCNSSKTNGKGEFSLTEMDGPDEFEDDFDDGFLDVDDDDGEFERDEDEIVMPLMNRNKWLESRPLGFGEGKVFDTWVEDKLVKEIEQSRKAQLANVNKLKNSTVKVKPGSKNEIDKEEEGSTNIGEGLRVRLLNLPKKKNIHKDLRLAFEGVRGILNIVPVVSGNDKTRDPVCKGFAFVDFEHQDGAQSFVQSFSGKRITFGKVQKQIKCEMMNPEKSNPTCDKPVDVKKVGDAHTDISPLDSWEESVPSEVDDNDHGDDEINGTLTTSDSDLAEELEVREGLAINSSSSKQTKKLKTNEKKVASKRRKDKIRKLNIPGSAQRLKIREKVMLTEVYSKYGATVKEHSR